MCYYVHHIYRIWYYHLFRFCKTPRAVKPSLLMRMSNRSWNSFLPKKVNIFLDHKGGKRQNRTKWTIYCWMNLSFSTKNSLTREINAITFWPTQCIIYASAFSSGIHRKTLFFDKPLPKLPLLQRIKEDEKRMNEDWERLMTSHLQTAYSYTRELDQKKS